MTPEDKRMICEYMKDAGWFIKNDEPLYILRDKLKTQTEGEGYWAFDVKFDLNDAGLVVKEMARRGDWLSFCRVAYYNKCFSAIKDERDWNEYPQMGFAAWIFDADNFFAAMVSWLRGRG